VFTWLQQITTLQEDKGDEIMRKWNNPIKQWVVSTDVANNIISYSGNASLSFQPSKFSNSFLKPLWSLLTLEVVFNNDLIALKLWHPQFITFNLFSHFIISSYLIIIHNILWGFHILIIIRIFLKGSFWTNP